MEQQRLTSLAKVLAVSAAFLAPALSADTATDLTVTGYIVATGNLDIRGNTASFGTEGLDAGYLLVYDSGADSISFNATSSAATWIWRQGPISSYQPQMELDSTAKLTLFRSGSVAGIEIDPSSTNGVANYFIKLTSGGTAANTSQRIAGYSDVQNGFIDFRRFATSGPATGVVIGTAGGDVITIRAAGSSDPGDVGIGTSTPSAKLEVVGDLKVSGSGSTIFAPSITLPDGSTLTSARSNTLYGTAGQYAGQSVASVDTSGKVNFANGITVGSGPNLATLTATTTALGVVVTATGHGATAMGHGTVATGAGATAMGDAALATGDGATAMGQFANANADGAIAIGNGVLAAAEGAVAIGFGSSSIGEGAIAMGFETEATNDQAIAIGSNTIASGFRATALGVHTTADAHSALAVGAYNVVHGATWSWAPQDDLVVVGNGTNDNSRSNALIIQKNGDARLAGTMHVKAGVRTPPMGDIGMGSFTAGPSPANLGVGLRYSGE